jgi:hypothetical protein
MTMPALNEDFTDLLAALLASGAEFLVVGAHAMAVHGVPRATGDLDVWVNPTRPNAARVLDALHRFGAPLGDHGVTAGDLETPGTVYQIGLPPRRVDVLTSVTGVSFEQAWEGRTVVRADGLPIPFLGRAELSLNKRATGRAKDLVDPAARAGPGLPPRAGHSTGTTRNSFLARPAFTSSGMAPIGHGLVTSTRTYSSPWTRT